MSILTLTEKNLESETTLNHTANKLKQINPHVCIKWPIKNMKLLHENKYITDQQWPTNRLLQINYRHRLTRHTP